MAEVTILRELARGMCCEVRIPGVCLYTTETTVLAHLNGGGFGIKRHDLFGAFACSACHDEIDRRTRRHNKDLVDLSFYQGIQRTQQYWLDHGYIQIVNAPQPKIQKILPRRY